MSVFTSFTAAATAPPNFPHVCTATCLPTAALARYQVGENLPKIPLYMRTPASGTLMRH